MAAIVTARLQGLRELQRELRALSPTLRRRVVRNALAAGGRVIRDAARRYAPVIAADAPAVRRGIRKPGTLRRAIRVRTSKVFRRAGDVGVFVNVQPAKGGARGARSPDDPFYWRFQEFQTRHARARPFLLPAAKAEQHAALRRIEQTLGPQIQRFNLGRGAR